VASRALSSHTLTAASICGSSSTMRMTDAATAPSDTLTCTPRAPAAVSPAATSVRRLAAHGSTGVSPSRHST
jgi:hypothetical protein